MAGFMNLFSLYVAFRVYLGLMNVNFLRVVCIRVQPLMMAGEDSGGEGREVVGHGKRL